MPISRKNPRARATRRRSPVPKFWKNKTVRNTIIAALSLAGITVVGVTGRQILLRSKQSTDEETPPPALSSPAATPSPMVVSEQAKECASIKLSKNRKKQVDSRMCHRKSNGKCKLDRQSNTCIPV